MGQGKSRIAIKKGVCLFYFLLPFSTLCLAGPADRRTWKRHSTIGFDYLILQKIAPKLLKLSQGQTSFKLDDYSSNQITKKEPKSDDCLSKFDWHDLSSIFLATMLLHNLKVF